MKDEVRLDKWLWAARFFKTRSLAQAAVAKRFGIPQPHVSELRNYKLGRFSSERIVRFITLLDRDIDIVIRPRDASHETGHVSVLFTV